MLHNPRSFIEIAVTTESIMAHEQRFDLPAMQELQGEEHRKLLDAIDSLRAYGLGGFTDLPQLIVCGATSSGKSSVLVGEPGPMQNKRCP